MKKLNGVVALFAAFVLMLGIASCNTNAEEPGLSESPVYYTVTFDSDGGSQVESKRIESGKTAVKPEDPAKTGYDFGGWYNGETKFDFTKPVTADTTLKAKWTTHAYTITYSLDGGTNDSENSATYTIEDEITLKDASKTGSTFSGWFNGDIKVTKIAKGTTGDITLAAKWNLQIYDVTLNANGGTIASGKNVTSYTYGTAATLPSANDITKPGYVFKGWFSDANYTGTAVTEIGTTDTGNKIFYAKWLETYTITYNGVESGITNTNPIIYTIEDEITLTAIEQNGYNFGGWYDAETGGNMVTQIAKGSTGTKTLWARWTIIEYTITYSGLPGGLENPNTTTSYTIESDSIEIKHIRTSDKFWYWYDAVEGGNKVTEIEKGSFGNRTLYARGVDFTYLNVSSMADTFKNAKLWNASYATSFRKSMTAPKNATVYLDDETQKAPAWYDTKTKTIWYYVPDGALLSFTSGNSLFSEMNNLVYLETCDFYTGKVTDMSFMFDHCSALTTLDVSNFDTSNVTNMSSMFNNCKNLSSLDLSGFDTSNVKNMSSMFNDCNNLVSLDLSGFDTSNVTDMSSMFGVCRNLASLDLSGFDTSNVTNMDKMFLTCPALTTLDVSGFDTSNVTSMSYMFYSCSALTTLDVSKFDTSNVTNISYMFDSCSALTTLELSNFDTSNVTSMSFMFYNCKKLASLDLSVFDTSNVTSMSYMFFYCSALTTLDLSNFDTSNVTNMNCMFEHCSALTTLDVSNFDTNNVTNMSNMFCYCLALTTLDVSNFNTSNVTNMKSMFNNCYKLSSLDLSSFDTSNVTDMSFMFYYCKNLASLDVSGFDTSKVTNMKSMFDSCLVLNTLDLSNFDISNVTDMSSIFGYCFELTTIYVTSGTDWSTSETLTDSSNMFNYCYKLKGKGGAGTKFDSNNIDKTYARIDGGTDSPGYFTAKE